MDGMKKNPSHSSRVTHPFTIVIADFQNANDSGMGFRTALTCHRYPRVRPPGHSPSTLSKLGLNRFNKTSACRPGYPS